ncbi:hypothetical protein COEREDRAFT_79265 [Coemansia reversa NRRL 1564]|uniref:Mid2 domain-containing protein n=1 Tax=Coemansia reversa (strain ATCC 12441 / NRRL 1564) TaxID=763665 RepID=A0A2G5BK01_COERN|nr:hypothetical protein COEREDRAFT_79265 [Coemansia reversa NRRL 1564]|eukprot:PIA19321.1 hypothetical protein COEREDRAFT_79265 [Coemansia reversa NRRL 1564]
MRVSKALCRALAATTVALTTTAPAAADPLASDTDKHIAVRRDLHPRGLLDGLAGILNVGRAGENDGTNGNNNLVGKADETGENTDTSNDDNKSTDNDDKTTNNTDDNNDDSTTQRPTDDSTSDKDTTTKDDTSSDKDTSSDRTTENSDKTSDDSDKTSEHHTPTDSHKDTDTDTQTDTDAESDPKPSTRTKTDTDTEATDSPTPTDSPSMVVVTATRPGVTTTTMIGPAPTIDDANGDKADVGSSGNLTSIIVASSVTAAALLLCTVLFYLYRRRRNRMTHGEEDFFAKGPLDGSPLSRADNTIATTSPFIPPAQSSGDGYTKPEDSAFYGAGAVSNDRRTEDSFRSQSAVNDNTHLLANQHYRSAATAPVTAAAASAPYAQPATNPHYRPQGTAPPAPPMLQAAAPAPYGARPSQQRMQVAGYPKVPRMPVQQQQQPLQQHSVFSPLQHNHGSTGP